jgi:hypothetical protein
MDRNEDVYLIWSNEHRGWWAKGGYGYVPGLSRAGRFTHKDAIQICRDAMGSSMQLGTIAEIPVRLVDIEGMLEGQIIPQAILTGGDR